MWNEEIITVWFTKDVLTMIKIVRWKSAHVKRWNLIIFIFSLAVNIQLLLPANGTRQLEDEKKFASLLVGDKKRKILIKSTNWSINQEQKMNTENFLIVKCAFISLSLSLIFHFISYRRKLIET